MASKFLPFFIIGLTLIPGQLAFNPQQCGRFDGVPRSLTSSVYKADAPTTSLAHNKVFILGGLTGHYGSYQQLTDAVRYDIITGESFPLPSFTKPVSYGAAVFHGNDIYYIGGGIPQEEVYDTHIFKLSEVPPVGSGLAPYQPKLLEDKLDEGRAGASAVSANGFIYIFGGYSNKSSSDDIIEYDPITGNQVKVAELPTEVPQTSTVVNNKDVYIFGKSPFIYKFNLDTKIVSAAMSNLAGYPPTNPVAVNVLKNSLAYVLDSHADTTNRKQIQFNLANEKIKEVCADDVIPSGIVGSTIVANNNVMIFGGNVTNNLRQSVLCINVDSMDKPCPNNNGASTLTLQLPILAMSFFAIKYIIN